MPHSFSSRPWSYDSSPYPPSSPSSSDFEYDRESHCTAYLRSSIAILPEEKLRDVMLKLANSDRRFQRAMMKEVSRLEVDPSPTTPTTPTPAKQRKWHRKLRQNVKDLTISTDSLRALSQMHHEIEYMYHPGAFIERACVLLDAKLSFKVVSRMKYTSLYQCFPTRPTSSAPSRCGVVVMRTSGVPDVCQLLLLHSPCLRNIVNLDYTGHNYGMHRMFFRIPRALESI